MPRRVTATTSRPASRPRARQARATPSAELLLATARAVEARRDAALAAAGIDPYAFVALDELAQHRRPLHRGLIAVRMHDRTRATLARVKPYRVLDALAERGLIEPTKDDEECFALTPDGCRLHSAAARAVAGLDVELARGLAGVDEWHLVRVLRAYSVFQQTYPPEKPLPFEERSRRSSRREKA